MMAVRVYSARHDGISSHRTDGRSEQISRRRDETKESSEQTHGHAVFRAAGGDEARARQHVSALLSCPLLSPVPLPLLLLLPPPPVINGGKREARGSLAEVKVNATKAREEV